jgi:hypothetical protein
MTDLREAIERAHRAEDGWEGDVGVIVKVSDLRLILAAAEDAEKLRAALRVLADAVKASGLVAHFDGDPELENAYTNARALTGDEKC